MWNMPWYDIIYLYKAYSDYVEEENKQQAEQQTKFEAEQQDLQNSNSYNSYANSINNDIANMRNAFSSSIPKF